MNVVGAPETDYTRLSSCGRIKKSSCFLNATYGFSTQIHTKYQLRETAVERTILSDEGTLTSVKAK